MEDSLQYPLTIFQVFGNAIRLTNAPAVFQSLVNDILWDYVDQFIFYIDDVFIYFLQVL